MKGNLNELKSLLNRKGIILSRDQVGFTVLHKSTLYSHRELVNYISSNYPATLDARDHVSQLENERFSPIRIIRGNQCFHDVQDGRTALHYAAALDDDRAIYNILVKNEASPLLPDYVSFQQYIICNIRSRYFI